MRKKNKLIIELLAQITVYLEDIRKLKELERKRNLQKDLNIKLVLQKHD